MNALLTGITLTRPALPPCGHATTVNVYPHAQHPFKPFGSDGYSAYLVQCLICRAIVNRVEIWSRL